LLRRESGEPTLFGIVFKFFKGAEDILGEETKIEIWLWLAGRKQIIPASTRWPNAFIHVFESSLFCIGLW